MPSKSMVYCFNILTFVISLSASWQSVEGHIFVDAPNVSYKDKAPYRVVFLPYPGTPEVNDTNTKLNFSIQKNNTDVTAVFVSLMLQDKVTGNIISQTPYKFHQSGDVTFPYVFKRSGDYIVTLQSRINGDPLYEQNPLSISFDLSINDVSNKTQDLLLYFVLPYLIIGVVIILLYVRESKKSKYSKGTPQK